MAGVTLDALSRMLWAKSDPYHPLWCHLLDAGAVCERLVESLGIQTELPTVWTVFLVALHDVGKADPRFQVKDDELGGTLRLLGLDLPSHKEYFPHEATSGDFVLGYLTSAEPAWGKHAARVAKAVAHGHHGNFNSQYSKDDSRQSEQWERFRTQLAEMVADVLGLNEQPFSPHDFLDSSSTGVKLTGLTVLSDWIASNEELFRFPDLDRTLEPRDYWRQARDEAARAVSSLQLVHASERAGGAGIPAFREVWPDITELKPSQCTLEEACKVGIPPGLAIIEAPMGEGKTESAIYLAECWRAQSDIRGAYIALPTMATSNQMHHRYRDFLSKRYPHENDPRLVHGMAWLIDDVSPQAGGKTYGEDPGEEGRLSQEWFRPSKRALIAPEAVGTVDQALMAALNVKHGFLRLLGLSSKVLIIDEVHAYDEYMTVILERLLEWLRVLHVPVIMLSATLSMRQKRRLVEAYGGRLPDAGEEHAPYPLITLVAMQGEPEARLVGVEKQPTRTIRLHQHPGMLHDAAQTASLAVELVSNGGCACVLVNTVPQAQAVFRELEDLDPGGEHYLFHARFPAWRRSEIEGLVVGLLGKKAVDRGTRPKRAVVVSTQVLEQSLDIDADCMISQLAPIDLLLQRVGRLWRHKETPRPDGAEQVLHILLPTPGDHEFGGSQYVYGKSALLHTMTILEGRERFDLPNDFRPLIEACYGDENVISSIISEREQMLADAESETKKELDAGKASKCLIPPPRDREFSLAGAAEARDESDEATDSYFSISTRLGGTTRSVLILEDSGLIDAARQDQAPRRDVLKKLFLHKVDIPAWWLKDVDIPDGPKWLRWTLVLPMRSGKWEGIRDGVSFQITDDRVLGVEMRGDRPE